MVYLQEHVPTKRKRVQYYLSLKVVICKNHKQGAGIYLENRGVFTDTRDVDVHRSACFVICHHPKMLSSHTPVILLLFGLTFVNQGQVTLFSHNMRKTENIEQKVLEAALLIFKQVTIKCIKKKKRKPNQSSKQLS